MRLFAIVVLLCSTLVGRGEAQKAGPEFVKQGLLIPGFQVDSGIDMRAATEAGNAARSAAKDQSNGREVEVISSLTIATDMEKAGFLRNEPWLEGAVRSLAAHTRADEYVVGRVERDGRGGRPARVSGTLVLMRDPRMRQPLPAADAPNLERAAEALGGSVVKARVQLSHLRHCENALRGGQPRDAMRAARAGVAAYPTSTLARTCLIWALRASGSDASEVLAVAREILAIDSTNFYALEAGAVALDSLGRRAESAPLWVRLASTDTLNLELTERALYSLHDGGSLDVGESLALRAAATFPDHLPFLRHQWRIGYARQSWPVAIAAGEALLARDSTARQDPVFFRRLAIAYRTAGHPFKAVETAASGVSRFPSDARLYSLYTQYVLAESDTVLSRGIAQFPRDGELLALHAQRLRLKGDLLAAVTTMREAITVDPSIPDGALMLAQSEIELGRPDSALASLRQALAAGTDSARLAQFVFARGSALYRAAQGTRRSADHALALRFIALADSVRPSSQSRLLLGMAALGVAQTSFSEAMTDADASRRCSLVQYATTMLPLARTALEAGREVAAEAAEQGIAYLDQLEPYSAAAVKGHCGDRPAG